MAKNEEAKIPTTVQQGVTLRGWGPALPVKGLGFLQKLVDQSKIELELINLYLEDAPYHIRSEEGPVTSDHHRWNMVHYFKLASGAMVAIMIPDRRDGMNTRSVAFHVREGSDVQPGSFELKAFFYCLVRHVNGTGKPEKSW